MTGSPYYSRHLVVFCIELFETQYEFEFYKHPLGLSFIDLSLGLYPFLFLFILIPTREAFLSPLGWEDNMKI